jgi:DNA-binding beta-propeller fold protein YncE
MRSAAFHRPVAVFVVAALVLTTAAWAAASRTGGESTGPARTPDRVLGPAALGTLTFDGCLANDPTPAGCGDLPPANATGPLDAANGVAVSPDGTSVYVVSRNSNSLSQFTRAPGGQLTFAGCVANDETLAGCTGLPPAGAGGPLSEAFAVVVSPSGNSVYVASNSGRSVTHFARGAGGQLTFAGCVADDGPASGCTDLPGGAGATGPLNFPQGLAISPDGAALYVTSSNGDGVSHFAVAAGGQLTFAGCIANDPTVAGCTDLPPAGAGGPLDGATGAVVSPDGGALYVASGYSDSLTRFARASGGQLTFVECVANDPATAGCADLLPTGAGGPLDGAYDVAATVDGSSLYVASTLSDSVSHFARSPGGQFTFGGCIANDPAAAGCTDAPPTGAGGPLDGALRPAVSPDGASVYVASSGSESISHFARASGGQLAFAGCLANGAAAGCGDLAPAGAAGPLSQATAVAVSPSGTSVYVTAFGGDSVTHLVRTVPTAPPPAPPAAPPAPPQPPATVAFCQGKRATIVGTAGTDRLRGTPGADVIAALGGNDTVEARGGADLVCGGAGADTLAGGAGADRLYGAGGADVMRGGPGEDQLFGGPGNDDLRGGAGGDRCVGGPLADRARGCSVVRSI